MGKKKWNLKEKMKKIKWFSWFWLIFWGLLLVGWGAVFYLLYKGSQLREEYEDCIDEVESKKKRKNE